ncbi:hypothetical protein [Clostridium arbusti]|uniref:hypothetical protein n=1 Tax=Clostridium arbusti TaxID=1137848 RepID=UPI000288D635
MMPNSYYNSLYRHDPSQEEMPIIPTEEKDDIFDNDNDNRQQQCQCQPVGSTLGINATPATPATPSTTPTDATGTVGGTGTIGAQGTTVPSVSLPATCSGCEPPVDSTQYTQGYLRTQIGKRVRMQFLLGTNSFQDRTGILEEVGISYVIIRNEETNTNELCDLYSIKFVDFF